MFLLYLCFLPLLNILQTHTRTRALFTECVCSLYIYTLLSLYKRRNRCVKIE